MKEKKAKLKSKSKTKSVLVIGLGNFGKKLSKQIMNLGNEVMGLEKEEDKLQAAMSCISNGEIGDATNEDVLRGLGIADFDLCIVAIGKRFEETAEITYQLKNLGAKKIIAVTYRDVQEILLKEIGADVVINPDKKLAEWTAIRFAKDNIFDYADINDECALYEIECPKEWVGKTLIELDIRKKYGFSIVGIKKDGITNLSISVKKPFEENEYVMIIGKKEDVAKL